MSVAPSHAHSPSSPVAQMRQDAGIWANKIQAWRDAGITLPFFSSALLWSLTRPPLGYRAALECVAAACTGTNSPRERADAIDAVVSSSLRIGTMEIHPSDVCNLRCSFCSFRDRRDARFLDIRLLDVLKPLDPATIWISGGGEPTLYRGAPPVVDFDALVGRLATSFPRAKCGFATNGVRIPPGNWQRHIDRMRFSLDAGTASTWAREKGRDRFRTCLKHLREYAEGPIAHISVGFLFTRRTVHELRFFVSEVVGCFRDCPELLEKLHLNMRPAMPPEPGIAADIIAARRDLEQDLRRQPRLREYLTTHSNLNALESKLVRHQPPACLIPLAYRVLRAAGGLHACIANVHPGDALVQLRPDSDLDDLKLAELRSLLAYAKALTACTECPVPDWPLNADRVFAT